MLEYTPRALVFSEGRLIADRSAAAVLCDPELVERAALKETSLFTLAGRAGIAPPEALWNGSSLMTGRCAAMAATTVLNYLPRKSPVHALTGATKLAFFLLFTFAAWSPMTRACWWC